MQFATVIAKFSLCTFLVTAHTNAVHIIWPRCSAESTLIAFISDHPQAEQLLGNLSLNINLVLNLSLREEVLVEKCLGECPFQRSSLPPSSVICMGYELVSYVSQL